jgi:hypothetical protein
MENSVQTPISHDVYAEIDFTYIFCDVSQIREMTKEQAAALMVPLEGSYRHNCRPLQPLNGRTVQLYDSSPKF